MGAELQESLGADVELIPGSGGIFEVRLDGNVVYTRAETGRFPREGEMTKIIKNQ